MDEVRTQIVDALLALLAERSFETIGLDAIAAKAGVTLGAVRAQYDGKLAILADFVRRTDRTVLDAEGGAVEGDTARERLFELVMRRLDTIEPHKAALASLERSARRQPALALCLNDLARTSARFTLAAAGIPAEGLRGAARVQGLVLLGLRVLAVWKDDTDPDLSKTMSALDHELDRAEAIERRLDRVVGGACRIARRFERRRAHPAPEPRPAPEEAAEASVG
ncbi:TetR family transcriptional regulator [Prosthecomicrobium pneumaticum]|uniref:AcrR family transcriptional regulator n=1 Tax=Prosthecomicrobium pneumaticum TaxID=81895 RepID=A0A7W9CU97_9HYPH|nr:TetR family transcriptional regulator [Prosthecomicrobium pneumaticum]MBB5752030.1 AcrR family transcriptional regulator [Prosthecomicrobium pneumaticum]